MPSSDGTRTTAAVTPPVPDRPVWQPLLVLVLVAVALHAALIANTTLTARDSIGFARYALNLGEPTRDHVPHRTALHVLREEKQPPGYPATVLLASTVVRPLWHAPLADQMLRSAQVASATAGVLLVVPCFWLARQLFDRRVAFFTALAFQFLPVVARDTSDGLTEALYLLTAATGLACGVWAVRGDSAAAIGRFLLCGMASGLAYLVRPEGVSVAVVVATVGAVHVLRGQWTFAGTLVRVVVLLVGFAVIGGPYMLAIGRFSNKPAASMQPLDAEPAAVGGPAFAKWIDADLPTGTRVALAVQACGEEWLKATYYGFGIFGVIGLILVVRRLASEPGGWVPLVYVPVNLAYLIVLVVTKGYVSERHLLVVALLSVLFAMGGLRPWFDLWAKVPGLCRFRWAGWPAVVVLAGLIACVPPLLKPMHAERVGHKHAGLKMKQDIETLSPEDRATVVVIDHYEWAQFFAERSLWKVPADPPPERQRIRYLVLELDTNKGEPENPRVDSERHKAAKDAWNDAANRPTVIYHWPEDGPVEQAKIVLAKQVVR